MTDTPTTEQINSAAISAGTAAANAAIAATAAATAATAASTAAAAVVERLVKLETVADMMGHSVTTMANAITMLTDKMAGVVAAIQHPGMSQDVKDLICKYDTMKERLDKAEGGVLLAKWLVGILGIGNVTLILLLSSGWKP